MKPNQSRHAHNRFVLGFGYMYMYLLVVLNAWFIALFVSVVIGKSQREIYSLNSQKYINYVLVINYVMYYILVRVIAFVLLSRHSRKPL